VAHNIMIINSDPLLPYSIVKSHWRISNKWSNSRQLETILPRLTWVTCKWTTQLPTKSTLIAGKPSNLMLLDTKDKSVLMDLFPNNSNPWDPVHRFKTVAMHPTPTKINNSKDSKSTPLTQTSTSLSSKTICQSTIKSKPWIRCNSNC